MTASEPTTMNQFIFVSCQTGSEAALKRDVARNHPDLAFAFSRPGFCTFKLHDDESPDEDLVLKSPFARSYGHSLGVVRDSAVSQVLALIPSKPFRHVHVWHRDRNVPGDRQFEPFPQAETLDLGRQLKTITDPSVLSKVAVNRPAKHGDLVADVIIVDPDLWFVGWHRVENDCGTLAGRCSPTTFT